LKIKSNLIEAHIIRINNGKIEYLILKRSADQKYPNIWQMVTGKIKEGETAYETAVREIKEETNLDTEKLYIVPNVNSFYNSDDDSNNLIPVFVSIVSNSSEVTISDEHQTFEWCSKKKAKKLLAWPGQLESVDIINDYFKKKKENLSFIEVKRNH